jgi:hypothetical protein
MLVPDRDSGKRRRRRRKPRTAAGNEPATAQS